jgi:monothiol glutaredoxin
MKSKEDVIEEIKNELARDKVVAYIKGTESFPQCGFSQRAVQILKSYNIKFKTINILADNQKREILKEFSEWPTYPQIFVNSSLIGGVDILSELHDSGELSKHLE